MNGRSFRPNSPSLFLGNPALACTWVCHVKNKSDKGLSRNAHQCNSVTKEGQGIEVVEADKGVEYNQRAILFYELFE